MAQFEQPKFNSRANNKKFEENFDRIFKKDKEKKDNGKKPNTP